MYAGKAYGSSKLKDKLESERWIPISLWKPIVLDEIVVAQSLWGGSVTNERKQVFILTTRC